MTDTPNIGLKKYGGTDPANLLTGYNASMDILDTVIKHAQDDIETLQDSLDMGGGSLKVSSSANDGQYKLSITYTQQDGFKHLLQMTNERLVYYIRPVGATSWTTVKIYA